MGDRRNRLEKLRDTVARYENLLTSYVRSPSGAEQRRLGAEMASLRGELARMIGRDKAAIIEAVGGTPQIVTGYRNFGDAFTVVLSDPDHPMATTAVEAVLRCVEQAVGYYADEDESVKTTQTRLELHPRITRVAAKLIRDGHLPQAAFEASKALVALLQERSGLTIDGLPLVERALSMNSPLLTFNALTTETDRDEHRGILHLTQGVVLTVRHVGAHASGRRHDDARTVELLHTINYLMHRVEAAKRQ